MTCLVEGDAMTTTAQRLFDELCTGARLRGESGEAPTDKQVAIAIDHGWHDAMMRSWRQGRALREQVAS